jgi:hypothetical protein
VFHRFHRGSICSGATEIEPWIRESHVSGSDTSRFHKVWELLKFGEHCLLGCREAPSMERLSNIVSAVKHCGNLVT